MGKFLINEIPPAGIALETVLEPIVAAAMRGQYELLLAETERAVTRLFATAPARVLLHVGGVWREWSALDAGADQPCAALPADLREWNSPGRVDAGQWFVPIVTGALGVMVAGGGEPSLCLPT